jgi:phosphatidylserine decarboxylase
MKAFYRLLTELSSRKAVSRITGAFAKSKLSKPLIAHFAKTYAIRTEDAEKPIHEYSSLNDFFTRRLKAGMRILDQLEHTVISPVDAMITGMGDIREGQNMIVKGQEYNVQELLNQSPRTVNYKNGKFIVLYLSPSDYHRIHTPVAGKIVEKDAIPGKVYPVNEFGLRHMRKVLSRNERLVTYMAHPFGELAVVKVGALNVSSIRYADPLPHTLAKGVELATFEFGSTVVLLMETSTFRFRQDLKTGDKISMGQPLGELQPKRDPASVT